MSQYNAGPEKGIRAAVNIDEGVIVKLDNGQVTPAVAASDVALGVTTSKAQAGEVASVRLRSAQGTTKVRAGGAITAGEKVTANANGKAVAATVAGSEVIGIALESGVLNDLVEVANSTSQLVTGA